MIELSIEHSFDFADEDYARLYRRGGLSAFQHPTWLSSFYKHLPKAAGFEPTIITGRSVQTGELALLLPLLRRSGHSRAPLEFAFLGVTDYACPVVSPEAIPYLKDTPLLRDLLKESGMAEALSIEPIRSEDHEVWQNLLGADFERLDYRAHARPLTRPYRARDVLGIEKARDVERKRRRLNERGDVRFEILDRVDARKAILDAAKLRAGRFHDDPLQKPEFVSFYSDIAASGESTDYSITCRLSCAGATVAILFGIIWHKTFCYLLLACDYENYARYSPGYLIFDQVLAEWSQRGGAIFDFTVGDEPFKARFGARPTSMFRTLVPLS